LFNHQKEQWNIEEMTDEASLDHSPKLNEGLTALERLSVDKVSKWLEDLTKSDLKAIDGEALYRFRDAAQDASDRADSVISDRRRDRDSDRRDRNHPPSERWERVRVDDNLSIIAKRVYGLPRGVDATPYAMAIYEANKSLIDDENARRADENDRRARRANRGYPGPHRLPDRYTIYPGQELRIPYLRNDLAEE
jgi:nucleoid-associated protein YgaU